MHIYGNTALYNKELIKLGFNDYDCVTLKKRSYRSQKWTLAEQGSWW